MFLVFLVILIMLVYLGNFVFLKYLVILVYSRGVLVFILYISCICWNSSDNFSKWFLVFIVVLIFMFDIGIVTKISDVGEYLWMYLFFRFLFNVLVIRYSLNLFKVAGSLRF